MSAEKLLSRCVELGLDAAQTELMKDLFGWNGEKGREQAYRGVEPQSTLLATLSRSGAEAKDGSRSIAELLRVLLRDKMSELAASPMSVLQSLGLSRVHATWVALQLGLISVEDKASDDIAYLAPELMSRIVMAALATLLDRKVAV